MVWLATLSLLCVSCLGEKEAPCRDEKIARLFTRTKKALALIYPDCEKPSDVKTAGTCRLSFLVAKGRSILTVAHHVPTTHPILVVYERDNGSSEAIWATVNKQSADLDLAVLEPDHAIRPAKYLELDLKNPPATGKRLALLTLVTPYDYSRDFEMRVPYIMPTTILAELNDGRFAADSYPIDGLCGAPLLDLGTECVIGIVTGRHYPGLGAFRGLLPMPNGTTFSLPELHRASDYAVVRSVFSAREFLRDLR